MVYHGNFATAPDRPHPLGQAHDRPVHNNWCPSLTGAAECTCGNALIRQVFDHVWLDHNQIVALKPTPLYLPLAAAVVEWQGAMALQKAAGQH